jgi:hypothetical protein
MTQERSSFFEIGNTAGLIAFHMIRSGERRQLVLSNKAITAYQRFRRERKVA